MLPLPAAPEALAAYLTERADSGICYGTLDSACSAIAQRHHQYGLSDPTADPVVARVRRGLRRIMGTAPRRQAHPLTVAELAQVVASIDTETPIGVRDRSVLLLGYAGPRCAPASSRRSNSPTLARRTGPLFTPVPAARPISRDGIGQRTVRELVRDRATAAGLGDLGVSGHSLRAGHATTAAVNGAPIDRIATQTRHQDLTTMFNHYIRPADALAKTTSRELGL